MEDDKGFFINKNTCICYSLEDKELQKNAEFLSEYIQFVTGMKLEVSNKIRNKNVIILRNDYKSENSEAYSLEVTPDFVIINGSRNAGTFYGNSNIKKSCSG